MASKKTKKSNRVDRAVIAGKNEKIINDLLLQFAYTLTIAVLTVFVFNATGDYKYGQGAYVTTRVAMWILFGISVAMGIIFAIMYKNKARNSFKVTAIYSFITAGVAFWYVGLEKVLYGLRVSWYTGTYQILKVMFPILAVAAVAEFTVYFVRYYSLNGKKR